MRNKHIITDQHISPELKARAKAMRSKMTPVIEDIDTVLEVILDYCLRRLWKISFTKTVM